MINSIFLSLGSAHSIIDKLNFFFFFIAKKRKRNELEILELRCDPEKYFDFAGRELLPEQSKNSKTSLRVESDRIFRIRPESFLYHFPNDGVSACGTYHPGIFFPHLSAFNLVSS